MSALYNDIESYAVELLNLRINDGWLPPGDVSNEDIRTLSNNDLSVFNHIHLFAGIGGFPLAARMSGFPDDFKLFTAGFPCQPFSNAGARAGTSDTRYLWPETLSALKSHRSDVAILENVAGLASMAFPNHETLMDVQTLTAGLRDYHYSKEALAVVEQIADDVEKAGYTVQALIIPACAVDAKHRRDRIWFVCLRSNLANANGTRQPQQTRGQCQGGLGAFERREAMADSTSGRRKEQGKPVEPLHSAQGESWKTAQSFNGGERCEWSPEPPVGRVVNGLSGRVDRIKGLGKAIVPQVAAEILTHILRALCITPVFVFPFGEAAE